VIHTKRRFLIKKVSSVEELAEDLTRCTWTLCTGFELEGYLFLNDAFSEDSAQEYAVIKDGRQVESITFGWCSREQAEVHIRAVLAGQQVDMGPVSPRLNHGKVCHLCR
jgi:hypothetical protein